MAKFAKPFRGVKSGEVYPVDFAPGDDCPAELEDAARECGAIAPKPAPAVKNKAK